MLFPCIYRITNQINGKLYIGKTLFDVNKRWAEHCKDYIKPRCEKRPLYSAMRKYGINNFTVDVLEECSPEVLSEREKYWIDHFQSYKNGYNATAGGDGTRYIINYDEIITAYLKLKNQRSVAKLFNTTTDTVRKILQINNVPIFNSGQIATIQYAKAVDMLSLNGDYIRTFPSCTSAAKYIVLLRHGDIFDEKTLRKKCKETMWHIVNVCKGKNETAYKYKWRYKEETDGRN